MPAIPWDYNPAQRQAARDAEVRAAIDSFELMVRRDRLAAAVARADARRQGFGKTIPAGQSAYRVTAAETPYPDRLSDDDVRHAAAQTAREAARATQISGTDLSMTQRSQKAQVAQYLIDSRNLRRVVKRDQLGRLSEQWIPGDTEAP